MRRTKHYKKQKGKKSRYIRTKKNKKVSRKMKGGFGSDLKDAFRTLKYDFSNAIGVGMVNTSEVAPAVKGGDNPLPFKQLGPGTDINSYNIASIPSSL